MPAATPPSDPVLQVGVQGLALAIPSSPQLCASRQRRYNSTAACRRHPRQAAACRSRPRGLAAEGVSPLSAACAQLERSDHNPAYHRWQHQHAGVELAASTSTYMLRRWAAGIIDNDVFPIRQLSEPTPLPSRRHYFSNVVNELSANPRMLILHGSRRLRLVLPLYRENILGKNLGTLWKALMAPAPVATRISTPLHSGASRY